MQETLEEAVVRQVAALTDQQWDEHWQERKQQAAQEQQAIENPQTLADYQLFVRHWGYEELDERQHVQFDQLLADQSRQRRRDKIADTVTQIESEGAADLELTIKQGWHDRKQCVLWIVQMSQRVDRPTYQELHRKCKMLDGWFSNSTDLLAAW